MGVERCRRLVDVWFSRVSLRSSLIALLLAVLATLLVDRAREASSVRADEIGRATTSLSFAARAGAERQAGLLAQARAILQLASYLPVTGPGASAACHESFRSLRDQSDWMISLFVYDLNGFPLCTSAERLAEESYADRPYFKEALARRDFAVSGYLVGRTSGKPIIIVAYPRLVDGVPEGVVGTAIDLASMSTIAEEIGAAEGAEALLLDRDLTVLAASSDSMIGRNLQDQRTLAAALRDPYDEGMTADMDGQTFLFGHAKLSETDATLAVMVPLDKVLRSANLRAWHSSATILLGGLLLCALIWLSGETFVMRPVKRLTHGVAQLGSGDLAIRMETAGLPPELRRLGESFNAMATYLQDRDTELRDANQRLTGLASRDPLTGLGNRRAFDERMASEWSRARRNAAPLALLVVDVDHFKSFNDTYGHSEGDECLRQVGAVLERSARRGGDFAARIGGEEFALILPRTNIRAAEAMAEHVRSEIERLQIEHNGCGEGQLTISVGVASILAPATADPRFLIDCADTALYRAKRAGRNRVAVIAENVPLAS